MVKFRQLFHNEYRGIWISFIAVVAGNVGFYFTNFGDVASKISKIIGGISVLVGLSAVVIIYADAQQRKAKSSNLE